MPVRSLKRTLAVIIQASAIVSVGAAVFGYAVAGRDEGVAGVSDATTRFLSPATHLAFAVLCGCVAWAIVARLTREVVVAAVSAAAITFLGFSRNAVIGLAAAAAYAVIVSLSLRTAQRAAVIALSLVISGAALVSVADANRGPGGMPGASFVAREWDAYKTRVFSSLSLNLSVNSSNSSLKWRATENVFAERAWRHHRVLGEGLGAYYRPPLGSFDTFAGQTGRHYIHNTYLWLLAKTGLLGLAAFLAFVLCPLGSLVFRLRRDPVAVSLGAAIVGLLAIGFVVPVPNDLWAAPALGIAVGLSQRRAREVSA
jgi:O-antigen ligase